MDNIAQEASLYYKTFPLSGRLLVHATIIVVVLNLAGEVGETMGRALYYFMH